MDNWNLISNQLRNFRKFGKWIKKKNYEFYEKLVIVETKLKIQEKPKAVCVTRDRLYVEYQRRVREKKSGNKSLESIQSEESDENSRPSANDLHVGELTDWAGRAKAIPWRVIKNLSRNGHTGWEENGLGRSLQGTACEADAWEPWVGWSRGKEYWFIIQSGSND